MLPDLQQYTRAQEIAAAAEMKGGQCRVLSDFMVDYSVMRDQTRALMK